MSAKMISFTCVVMLAVVFLAGCVERKLTINTNPQGALVVLNDEEIGTTPVTVAFSWYGDYKVRITKQGFASMATHRVLKQPMRDKFPADFFYGVLWPGRIVDAYEWTFDLEPYKSPDRAELIEAAKKLREQAGAPLELELANLQYELEHNKKKK